MDFKDKTIVITGGASGIGASCAKLFSNLGATIILADLNIDMALSIVSEIASSSLKHKAVHLDVTNYSQVEQLVKNVTAQHDKIDIWVNSAGIMNKQRLKTESHTFEDWDNVISVNQTGTFYCMRAVLSQMSIQGHGNIVNLASLAGLKASGYNLAYSASKFAVVGMTKSAAMEYASKNIRINAVCPSYTHTPMLEDALTAQPGFDKKILNYVPMGRFGDAEEIAQAVLWLASDNTSFITGQTITLDGGLSL